MAVQSRPYAPLHINRFYSGLITQRSPLFTPWYAAGMHIIEKHDALIDGLNTDINNSLSLIRRAGFTSLLTSSAGSNPDALYGWHDLSSNYYTLIDCSNALLQSVNGITTSILTKSINDGQAYVESVGNQLYIGTKLQQKRWSLTEGLQNWGITQVPGATGTASAYATTSADVTYGVSSAVWTNYPSGGAPTNAEGAPDSAFVVTSTGSLLPIYSDYLACTNYSWSGGPIGAGNQIGGFIVNVTGYQDVSSPSSIVNIGLWYNGAPYGDAKQVSLNVGSSTTVSFGTAGDLWGNTGGIPLSIANSASFGAYVWVFNNTGTQVGTYIDAIQIQANFSSGLAVTLVGGGFNPAPSVGYHYVACYGDGVTGHISSPTAPSNLIKPDASHSVQISLVASADPQVNLIHVFRTADGGSTYFELPTSPYANSSTPVTDSAADTTLNTLSIAPLPGNNNPPLTGLINLCFHMGRMWGSIGNVVYYSGGPETTNGDGNQAFPVAANFEFPGPIYRLVPNSIGLLVFLNDATYVIRGVDSTTFYPDTWQNQLGIANYNAVAVDGNNIYAYTTDRQLLLVSQQGIQEIGFSIGDVLQTYDPATVYLSVHRASSQDQGVFFASGGDVYRYSFDHQFWTPKWRPFGGSAKAMQSVEVTSGVWRLLVANSSGNAAVYYRDLTTNADASTPYSAFATIGTITLAQPGMLSSLQAIITERASAGSEPTYSLLLNEVSGSFTALTNPVQEPPLLQPSTSFVSKRYLLKSANLTSVTKYAQLKITFATENAANAIYSVALFHAPYAGGGGQQQQGPAL